MIILYLALQVAVWFTIAMLLVSVWIPLQQMRGRECNPALYSVYQNTLPFLWLSWVAQFMIFAADGNTLFAVMSAFNVLIMVHTWKSDHDDRWTKRRKKAESKIREVGGRLIIEPVASPT